MTKGIVDPWRVTTPTTPEKLPVAEPGQKISLADINPDAELRVTQFFVLSSKHGSIRVDSKDITSDDDAMVIMLRGFAALIGYHKLSDAFRACGVGFSVGDDAWNVTNASRPVYKTERTVLYFEKDYDHGMRALVKMLCGLYRTKQKLLRKYNITPLMR